MPLNGLNMRAHTKKTCRNFIWIFCLFVWKRNAVGVGCFEDDDEDDDLVYGALVEVVHGCGVWAILQVNFEQVGKKRCFAADI